METAPAQDGKSSAAYLAFDLGASSGRAILGRMEQGKITLTEVHRFPNHPVEHGGELFWNFDCLCRELETGLGKAFSIEKNIVSFSIDTWGVDIVFFRNGKAIRQPRCYRDPRFPAAQRDVHRIIPAQKLFTATGIQPLPFNTVYQLFAFTQDRPEDFGNDSIALFLPDALLYHLTGEATTEYTIASTGAMLQPGACKWNLDLLGRLGIPAQVLTPLVPPGTRGALLKDSLAKQLGIPRIPCVKCASHDTASAVAALPSAVADNVYLSLGTWALLGAELRKPNLSSEAFEKHYTNEGGLDNTIRFLVNITGTWLIQETRRVWREKGLDLSFAELSSLASHASTAKRFNPDDSRFATPGDMPGRIQALCRETGQGEFSSRGELLRCIYESLSDSFRNKLRDLESILRKKHSAFHILGGGTQDSFLMSLTAEKLNLPVVTGPVEATAIGNLLVQFLADGTIRSLTEGREKIARSFNIRSLKPGRSST